MLFRRISLSVLLTSALTLGACAGGDTGTDPEPTAEPEAEADGGHEDHGPEEELCEHMANGPEQAVTAGADAASAVDISDEHTRYDITLGDDGNGGYAGFVAFAADEDGEFFVALSDTVDATFTTSAGDAITIEETEEGSEECDDVARIHVLDFEVGTVNIELASADADVVSVVIEHGGEHEEE